MSFNLFPINLTFYQYIYSGPRAEADSGAGAAGPALGIAVGAPDLVRAAAVVTGGGHGLAAATGGRALAAATTGPGTRAETPGEGAGQSRNI